MMLFALAIHPRAALASSFTPHLNGIGGVRFGTISFFLMVFVVSTLLAWRTWGSLHRRVPLAPRPSLTACLGVEVVMSMLLAGLLLMIAPARPLMEPGAWEAWEERTAYDLRPVSEPAREVDPLEERREALERLRYELWEYALCNGGQFPVALSTLRDREVDCTFPGSPGMEFCYVPGLDRGDHDSILAFEPDVLGEPRLVLGVSGRITAMSSSEIRQAIESGESP